MFDKTRGSTSRKKYIYIITRALIILMTLKKKDSLHNHTRSTDVYSIHTSVVCPTGSSIFLFLKHVQRR
jgi:hypothetical protein